VIRTRSPSFLLLLALTAWIASPAEALPSKVSIAGDTPLNGMLDPSIEFAPGAEQGWLVYSAVFGSIQPWGPHVETHLARTTDAGASWTFDSVINASTPDTLQYINGSTRDGVWNYEVSSLVHDPGDPGAEWKLFSHRIFRLLEDPFVEDQSLPAYSWIVMRTAAHPTGPWSDEDALFGSDSFPPAPYNDVRISVNQLDPSLASLIVYSEPGAFVEDSTLYLSLTGLLQTGSDRILLLASDDHGTSWRFVDTLLTNMDAAALGFVSFDGSAIVRQGGRRFLLVTPESPGVLHDGTLVLPFEDLATGSLEREGGVPVVEKHLPSIAGLPLNRRGGQADYHDGAAALGILQPSIQVGALPELFQFFTTGVRPATIAVPSVSSLGALLLGFTVIAMGHWWLRFRAGDRKRPQ